MNQNTSLERMVAGWMADETVGAISDRQVHQILDITARQRPWPRWLAVLREPPMHAQSRVVVGSPTQRLLVLGALVLLAAGAVLVAGAALLLRSQPVADDCGKVPLVSGSLPAPAASTELPDPFSIVAEYSATNLGLDRPLGMAVGPNCDIYVTDLSDRVSQYSPDGKLVRRWGGIGIDPGKFHFETRYPEGNDQGAIAVGPDGNVYVSDSGNWRVQVFSAEGSFIRQFGSQGKGDGQFTIPFDLGVDASGNVYVEDDFLMRLSKFSPDKGFVWSVDKSTDAALDGHGHSPTVDGQGRILVINDDKDRLVYLDPDGHVLGSFASGGGCSTAVDHAGYVFVTACEGAYVNVFDAGHRQVAGSTGRGIGAPRFGPGGEVVALGPDGQLQMLSVRLPGS
jgi:hypothetical protein